MKELSTEEKAKAYDEALKVLHKYDGANIMFTQDLKEEMFPELRESEDERIRKQLIVLAKGSLAHTDEEINEMLAWLEKQGENKDILDNAVLDSNEDGLIAETIKYKNEQKSFHEGDWVVSPNGVYWHIDKIFNNRYEVTADTGEQANWSLDTNIYHKFNIQDAKDGDVLATENKNIFIFNSISDCTIYDYCGLYFGIFTDYSAAVNIPDAEQLPIDYVPATKEQRDLLFQKMKEAGYEWNAEKKELNKIEQKPAEWTEEDKELMKWSINNLTELKDRFGEKYGKVGDCINWLKSLRPQWKPSEEQMKALWDAIVYVEDCNSNFKGSGSVLENLYNDLKKLKE